MEARSRALLSDGEVADGLYREAIERLERTRVGLEVARAHLVYGEWLRGEHRLPEAREQLRAAREMFTSIGVEAFARRAGRELSAMGERVRRRIVERDKGLTPQEEQIARLARDGLSNPEIGARQSSVRLRSNTTCTRCSASWTSARAPSSKARSHGNRCRSWRTNPSQQRGVIAGGDPSSPTGLAVGPPVHRL